MAIAGQKTIRVRVAMGGIVSVAASLQAGAVFAQSDEKTEAAAFFREKAPYTMFLAVDPKSGDADATGVTLIRGNHVKADGKDGCRTTFASETANVGKGVGAGLVAVDWSLVRDIDVRAADSQRGIVVQGGIENNFGPKPQLRIVSMFGGAVADEWVYHLQRLWRVCSNARN